MFTKEESLERLVNCNTLPKTVNNTNLVNKAYYSNVSYIFETIGRL